MNRPFSPPPTQDSTPIFVVSFTSTVHGRRATGTYEMDFDRMSANQIVQDIIEGQYESIDRVFALEQTTPTGGIWSDVTTEFATEVRDRIGREPISWEMKDWLHRHLGVMSTHGMVDA